MRVRFLYRARLMALVTLFTTTPMMASEKPLKIKSALSKKRSRSAIGAPSQHNQSSRKGKKAWRKNVDIGEVEQGLEGLRQEERVTGYSILLFNSFLPISSDLKLYSTILQKIKDSDLFTVDLTGDDQGAYNSSYLP